MSSTISKSWKEKKHLFATYYEMEGIRDFISAHPDEALITLSEFADCNSYWVSVLRPALLEKFTPEFVRQAVGGVLHERIALLKSRTEELFKENDDMRNRGVPFATRKAKV